jgi:archaellum biogenesis ATPase FlaH
MEKIYENIIIILVGILLFIFMIAFIIYKDKKRTRKYNMRLLNNVKKHYLQSIHPILNLLLNFKVIPYNKYIILITVRDKIDFGHKLYLFTYLIDWYDYHKLKYITNKRIHLININKLKRIESELNTNLCEVTLTKGHRIIYNIISYEKLETLINKEKL